MQGVNFLKYSTEQDRGKTLSKKPRPLIVNDCKEAKTVDSRPTRNPFPPTPPFLTLWGVRGYGTIISAETEMNP